MYFKERRDVVTVTVHEYNLQMVFKYVVSTLHVTIVILACVHTCMRTWRCACVHVFPLALHMNLPLHHLTYVHKMLFLSNTNLETNMMLRSRLVAQTV